MATSHLLRSRSVGTTDSPHKFTGAPDGLGPDFLFVENVARLLACNVDFVRRIPRSELPASKIGTRLVYARADVLAYIAARRDAGSHRFVSDRAQRTPSAQRETSASEPHGPAQAQFDPVARAKALTRGSKAE